MSSVAVIDHLVGTSFLSFFKPSTPTLRILLREYSEKSLLYKMSTASVAFMSSLTTLSSFSWILTLLVILAFLSWPAIPWGITTLSLLKPGPIFFFNSISTSTGFEAKASSWAISTYFFSLLLGAVTLD